jgi:hypothetical protein
VRIGDMAAGTLLIYESAGTRLPAPVSMAGSAGRLDARGAELITELLERWATLERQARVRLAQQLLARYGADARGANLSGAADTGGTATLTDDAALHAELVRLAAPASRAAQ